MTVWCPTVHDLASVGSGVAAHVFVFRCGEWDMAAPKIFVFYETVLVAALAASYFSTVYPIPSLLLSILGTPQGVLRAAACHAVGLYSSMLIYRAWLHRLRAYPGPFLARLTNFYITARSVRKLHLYEEVRQLHARYGDYVRIGPSELSIADPQAVKAIYGSHSPVTKGPWYNLLEPRVPLFMARDKQEHARRRKVWDQGFTTKAIQGYDPRITKAIYSLLAAVERHKGQPFDLARWFAYLAFDIMEDLAFNKSADMLGRGEDGYVFKTIRADMYNIAFFSHLPWLLPFLKRTPILNKNYRKFLDWIQILIDERAQKEPAQPDIFSPILAAFRQSAQTPRDRLNLHGDAQLIVIAGSDSVAAALTHVFFELAWDPALVARLQAELDALPSLEHQHLLAAPLLDAVIYETMRLHPPVPSGTQRVTPPEGLRIGERWVPGGTIVQVPSYTVFRDPRAFAYPEEFIPERWTTRPELVRDRSVFIPFNAGPYACIGKRLAMLEMRRVIAELLSRYDLAVAPGQTKDMFLDGKQDTFTTVSAPLPVIFQDRVKTAGGEC
ncbi:hypothetical protein VTJ83DRAFT_7075 [Remersonia thermophila]|uniref:Cytochrome P450 n=1 Tax=Remersonia thermophila TaxID=72144 RepID=A0ABR4D2G4_9PEZI